MSTRAMDLAVYKIMHLFGLALVLTALGGATLHALKGASAGSNAEPHPNKGLVAATHGVGMVLMLVGGFGMLAKLQAGMMPGWIHPKLLIWVVLGAAPALIKRKAKLAVAIWWSIPILVAAAAAIAIYKPGA